MSDVNKRDKLI